MTADARLTLSEDLGQVLDVQLAAGEQRQNTQPRGLSGGARPLKDGCGIRFPEWRRPCVDT